MQGKIDGLTWWLQGKGISYMIRACYKENLYEGLPDVICKDSSI